MGAESAQLQEVRRCYQQGLYLDAYEVAQRLGPFEQWPGAEGKLLAARLVANLGDRRQAHTLIYRGRREYPRSAEVAPYTLRIDVQD